MTPAELRDEVLGILRREFFAGKHEKRWFQERRVLLGAILEAPRFMKRRFGAGARLPGSKYRAILIEIIETIKKHGKRDEIERFSIYFLHCVQSHLEKHGDEYYQQSKRFKTVAEIVPGALRKASTAKPGDPAADAMVQARDALTFRSRRKSRFVTEGTMDLFAPCKTPAKRPRRR